MCSLVCYFACCIMLRVLYNCMVLIVYLVLHCIWYCNVFSTVLYSIVCNAMYFVVSCVYLIVSIVRYFVE